MRKQLAFITALMALTLGVGIFAGARQSTDSHGVDVALEEARQHVKADSDDMPALRENRMSPSIIRRRIRLMAIPSCAGAVLTGLSCMTCRS